MDRINLISKSVNEWLSDKSGLLRQAVEKTVSERLFPRHDVMFQLNYIREAVTPEALREWISTAGKRDGKPEKVLALHAGNLPLVGFQDVIAILLSGKNYMGKISKKDPYLLPSFLNVYREISGEEHHQWSTDISELKGKAGRVMFTGSEDSIPAVKETVRNLNLAEHHAKWLIRKAHFSIAYISEGSPQNLEKLANAILRFEGRGCRSVAAVVAPFSLADDSCTFTDFLENFWLQNPPSKKRTPKTEYQIALNKAIERMQYPVEHLLFQECVEPEFGNEDVINWIKGDINTLLKISESAGENLQTVYEDDASTIRTTKYSVEKLQKAQRPDIYWKPDGTDTLEWLKEV